MSARESQVSLKVGAFSPFTFLAGLSRGGAARALDIEV